MNAMHNEKLKNRKTKNTTLTRRQFLGRQQQLHLLLLSLILFRDMFSVVKTLPAQAR